MTCFAHPVDSWLFRASVIINAPVAIQAGSFVARYIYDANAKLIVKGRSMERCSIQ